MQEMLRLTEKKVNFFPFLLYYHRVLMQYCGSHYRSSSEWVCAHTSLCQASPIISTRHHNLLCTYSRDLSGSPRANPDIHPVCCKEALSDIPLFISNIPFIYFLINSMG